MEKGLYQLKPVSPSLDKIDYAAQLNTEQLAAVTAAPGPILVIAGAGSGKTRTLTYRVSYLIEHGAAPENILLLTFTNKAAHEMLDRVNHLIPHDLTRLWGGTFHHIGNRILRPHIYRLGYNPTFSILDRDDSTSLMKTCIDDAKLKAKTFPKADVIVELFSLITNKACPLEELVQRQFPQLEPWLDPIVQLQVLYQQKKVACNAVDYDDLLSLPLRLFYEHEEILREYQEKFHHILVDEYQDTNKIQAELIDLLGGARHHIMAVGDDAQSIYSWRGAVFENMLSFPERHPNTQILRLETNYRSTPEILKLANETIAHNTRQFSKHLTATRPLGNKPIVLTLDNSRLQSMFVAQRAMELHEQGVPFSEMAVLYRSHFHSMEVQMELTRQQIPFYITSGPRFFEQAHVKDIAAYLRFLLNPRDELSFKRVAQLLPGVGEKTCAKIWQAFSQGQAWDKIKIPEKAVVAWKQWGETDQQLREQNANYAPSKLIEILVEAIYGDYLDIAYTNASNRKEDLNQLRVFAENFTETGEFLSQLALLASTDTDNLNRGGRQEDALRLSTIHQAKGLEYQAVFILMLCDGMFPSFRSIETTQGEEEERRLFYVATTRAKDELYLCYPKLRPIAGQGDMYQTPSRFLSEFSTESFTPWRVKAPEPTYSSWEPSAKRAKKDESWDEEEPF